MIHQYRRRREVALALVEAVAHGRSAGCYLWGRAGIGKSFSVRERLDKLGVRYEAHGGHMTGLGLFDSLAAKPNTIHVLDDLELLLRDRTAQAIIRQAGWTTDATANGKVAPRMVEYRTKTTAQRIEFCGGLVMLGNSPPGDSPILAAVASRLEPIQYDLADEEVVAAVREWAGQERGGVTAAARTEVAEFLFDLCAKHDIRPDFRMWENAVRKRQQWDAGHSAVDWREVVAATVQGEIRLRGFKPKKLRVEEEIQLVVSIDTMPERARLERWRERTGKSDSTYWRRRSMAVERGLLESHRAAPQSPLMLLPYVEFPT